MAPRRLSRVLFESSTVTPPNYDSAARLTGFAWDDYQRGRLGAVVAALPGLIETAQALDDLAEADRSRRRDLLGLSARIHHLAATTLIRFGEVDLAWIAAERAIRAGDSSGDPLVLASAARAATHALLGLGRYQEAFDLGMKAVEWLQQHAANDDPAALSLAGMLYLRMALAASKRPDRAATTDLLGRAREAARRLGYDGNLWHTSFGPTNVVIHRFAAALDLGDVAYVAERGVDVPVEHMPLERAVSFRIDVARGLSLAGRDRQAIDTLLNAERSAPGLVRHNVLARETVRELHRRDRGHSSALTELAQRCRAVG